MTPSIPTTPNLVIVTSLSYPTTLPFSFYSGIHGYPITSKMCQKCANFIIFLYPLPSMGLPWWLSGKESTRQCRRPGFYLWVGKISWRKKWQPTPVFLPGKFPGQRNLAGYSLWGRKRVWTWQQLNNKNYIAYSSYRYWQLPSPPSDLC